MLRTTYANLHITSFWQRQLPKALAGLRYYYNKPYNNHLL
jgi:hypothetical protein